MLIPYVCNVCNLYVGLLEEGIFMSDYYVSELYISINMPCNKPIWNHKK